MDCIEGLKLLDDESIDAVVTDPPYELGFMGKSWDKSGIANNIELWKEVLRVLKSGGHLLAFGGTRTYHRMTCAIEDAGFQIRDCIMWVYGSGFPKSLNIGKAIDKQMGISQKVVGFRKAHDFAGAKGSMMTGHATQAGSTDIDITIAVSQEAKQWEGWGTAVKPSLEPIVLARKPLSEKTVAENVLKWGTGGINIDGCRVELSENDNDLARENKIDKGIFGIGNNNNNAQQRKEKGLPPVGRFPANLIHDGSEEVLSFFPDVEEESEGVQKNLLNAFVEKQLINSSRFFYCAKASKSERNEGLSGKKKITSDGREKSIDNPFLLGETERFNHHPTVKPIALMSYLIKLITPPKGIVLDPFAGSGSTFLATRKLGFNFIGFEKEANYCEIAESRIQAFLEQKKLGEEK